MPDQITVLTHPVALLTKRWYLDAHGKPAKDDYGFAKTFQCQVIDLAGAEDLYELLDVLATEPHRCVIRGQPIPGRDLSAVLRRAKAKGDEPACFKEQPRRWVMLDLDLLDTELLTNYTTPEGCAAVINTALSRLPAECRAAGCWWQLSSSAGMKSGIRCHLWFYLDRVLGQQELQRWAESANEQVGKVIIDKSVFHPVQIHYTANPVFDGVVDVVAQRTGRIEGPPLCLPRLAARAGAWRQKLAPLANPNNTSVHEPVRNACAAYFCALGPDAPVGVLSAALRQAVDASCEARGVEDSKYDDAKLAEYIESGRTFAAARAAEGENLVLGTDGTPKLSVGNALKVLRASAAWQDLVGYNRRTDQVVILREPPWGGSPRPWTDDDSVEAAGWLLTEHRMAIDDSPVWRAVRTIAKSNAFDPVADVLNALVWDGRPRLDDWLMRWCGCATTAYNTKVCRIWPISAVARAMNTDPAGVQVDTMLVLQGKTGVGKTSLLRVMANGFYAAIIDNKDMVQKIHGPWIVEFPELGPFKSLDVNGIKSFLDQKFDRHRVPYARLVEDAPRSCVIVATTNETGWQEDATSARRFWPVDVHTIDLVLAEQERDQLWAEAVVAYKSGEAWHVSAEDPDFVAAQEAQYAHDSWQDKIEQGLTRGANNFCGDIIPKGAISVRTSQVLAACLSNLKQTKHDQVRVSKCMRKLGWAPDGKGNWLRKDLTSPQPPAMVARDEAQARPN